MPADESPAPSPPPPPIPPPRKQDRPRFQFSLRSQLTAVTAVAVLLGLYVVAPRFLTLLFVGLIQWLLPAPLVAGVVYGREDIRAFSIGGLIPWLSAWFGGGQAYLYAARSGQSSFAAWMPVVGAAVTILASGACGLLVVATRRWLGRHSD